MAISDLIKVTKSKIKQYYDSQNVMQCRCRLHSCNHGKIVQNVMQCRCRLHSCNHGKIVLKLKKNNVLPYKEKNLLFNYISVEKLLLSGKLDLKNNFSTFC